MIRSVIWRTTRQVVRDEEQARAQASADIAQDLEDLRLHGDVEGRDRLIAHEQLRRYRHGPRDRHPLALAPGECDGAP